MAAEAGAASGWERALKQTIASERRGAWSSCSRWTRPWRHRRRALAGGADRRHLHHLRLGQRFFRGEHWIAGGKYLAVRALFARAADDPRPGSRRGSRATSWCRRSTSRRRSGRSRRARLTRRRRPLVPARRAEPVAALDPATAAGGGHRPGPGQRRLRPQTASVSAAKVGQGQGRRPKGVNNLDQEKMATKTVANGNFAPPTRRCAPAATSYVLDANGESELYDLVLDPAQLRSKHADPRYRFVRQVPFGQLVTLATCRSADLPHRGGPDPRRCRRRRASRSATPSRSAARGVGVAEVRIARTRPATPGPRISARGTGQIG